MQESKFLKNYYQKNKKTFKSRIKNTILRLLYCFILCLILLIVLKIDKNGNRIIYNYLQEHNISFAVIKNNVLSYAGKIFPSIKEEEAPVFNETITFSSSSIYQDGVSLTVKDNYLVPTKEAGVVVFKGEKEFYGNTVIVETSSGILIWYGNLESINIDIYDYVEKGEFLGTVKENTLYMVFQKDGEFLDYKEYLI